MKQVTSTPKYLVFGDFVISKNDGDKHYIHTNKLIRLYGVPKEECREVNVTIGQEVHCSILRESLMRTYPKAKVLRPRYDGNYKIV